MTIEDIVQGQGTKCKILFQMELVLDTRILYNESTTQSFPIP